MKNALLLLAATLGAVRGTHLRAEVQGVSSIEDPCTEDVQEALYDECVVDEAISMGFSHTRRLELRGNRELGVCGACPIVKPPGDFRNHFCMRWGCWERRRLTVAGEHVHTERFLSEKGQIEDAAVECLRKKITDGYKCLGNKEDLAVRIFLSDLIDLGSACNYAILAKTGISTVPNSVVTGDIGVSPIASAHITGFDLDLDSSGEFSTASQVVGKTYASDYSGLTPADMTAAVSAMEAAYTNAAAQFTNDSSRNNIGEIQTPGTIGGKILTPGVYTFTVVVNIDSDLTFEGGADDVFVIQTTGDLTQAANTQVLLKGGAQAKNIFWQVAGFVEIGAGASMQGILLVKTKVDFITGSSLVGRVLAQTAVNLQMATITQAAGTCN